MHTRLRKKQVTSKCPDKHDLGFYYDSPVFDDDSYDSRSPSPGIRKVKRPLNAFMLYRKDKQGGIPTSNQQSLSRIIGAMWKSESDDTKAKYNAFAQIETEKHRQAYPGYKYSPKKRINKDKKVRRMSRAAHAKLQEEEKQILRQINKRSQSEGTLSKPHPEFLNSKPQSLSFEHDDENQMNISFPHLDDLDDLDVVEMERMTSRLAERSFCSRQSNSADAILKKRRVQNVFAEHGSLEGTVNPQDLLAKPEKRDEV